MLRMGRGLSSPFAAEMMPRIARMRHAASINKGTIGTIHGFKCYTLQDEQGEILPVHSIAAGLDYPGVGPEHSYYAQSGRAEYVAITDEEAMNAFFELSRLEGIIPAIESSHAIAHAMKLAKTLPSDKTIIVNLSGRGDKDIGQIIDMLKNGDIKGHDIHMDMIED